MTKEELEIKYPRIAFNDSPKKRSLNNYLFLLDAIHKTPSSYDIKIMRQYKGIITWNQKVFEQLKRMGANVWKIPHYPFLGDDVKLNSFLPLSEKNGLCLIDDGVLTSHSYNINTIQYDTFMNMKDIERHAYGSIANTGNLHIRDIDTKLDKLQIINEHVFCMCFDDISHTMWSWDYLTEKIIDCFKAKTIPIYMGCYNIEDKIPEQFFINYKYFKSSEDLSAYLFGFDFRQYETIVNDAHTWIMHSDIGSIKPILGLLDKLTEG